MAPLSLPKASEGDHLFSANCKELAVLWNIGQRHWLRIDVDFQLSNSKKKMAEIMLLSVVNHTTGILYIWSEYGLDGVNVIE